MTKPEKVRVDASALRTLVEQMFGKLGMPGADAKTVADVLVWANLRGIDSHGIARIPRYVEMFASGEANAAANIVVGHPRPAVVTIEANAAAGPVAMTRGVREAIAVARTTGVAWAAIRGTVHTGAIGYYTSLAASEGMVGIGMVAGVPNMAYFGSRGAAVATSPLSIAVPSGRHGVAVLDMATAVIALGKIAQMRLSNTPLAEGMALTEAGEPTTDPALAEIPMPLGGAKGSGMSLMFEFLTSGLVNNPIVTEFHTGTPHGQRHRQNGSLIVVDIAAFTNADAFKALVDATLDTLKGLPRATGCAEILFPGERGARTYAQREGQGIPVPGATWQKLGKDAAKLGVPVPEPLAAPQ